MKHTHVNSDILSFLKKELQAAKQSIYLIVPWFNDLDLFNILLDKAKKGIKVKIIIQNNSINRDAKFKIGQIEQYGGEIYINGRRKLIHAKVCVIDKQKTIKGSYNWTYNARKNYEEVDFFINQDLASKQIKNFITLSDELIGQNNHNKLKLIYTPAKAYRKSGKIKMLQDGYLLIFPNGYEIKTSQIISMFRFVYMDEGKYIFHLKDMLIKFDINIISKDIFAVFHNNEWKFINSKGEFINSNINEKILSLIPLHDKYSKQSSNSNKKEKEILYFKIQTTKGWQLWFMDIAKDLSLTFNKCIDKTYQYIDIISPDLCFRMSDYDFFIIAKQDGSESLYRIYDGFLSSFKIKNVTKSIEKKVDSKGEIYYLFPSIYNHEEVKKLSLEKTKFCNIYKNLNEIEIEGVFNNEYAHSGIRKVSYVNIDSTDYFFRCSNYDDTILSNCIYFTFLKDRKIGVIAFRSTYAYNREVEIIYPLDKSKDIFKGNNYLNFNSNTLEKIYLNVPSYLNR